MTVACVSTQAKPPCLARNLYNPVTHWPFNNTEQKQYYLKLRINTKTREIFTSTNEDIKTHISKTLFLTVIKTVYCECQHFNETGQMLI